jgi:hypothetical protein
MQIPNLARRLRLLSAGIAGAIASFTGLGSAADASLESGIYQTISGATVRETGDNVANGSRFVPLSATLRFDLAGVQPSLEVVIHDAVLEGGSPYADLWLGGRPQPFELIVRSSFGVQLPDGSYRFGGDYLQDIVPSGSQYIFDWRFSSAGGENPSWTGQTYWAGGHLWDETISGITLVPEPGTVTLLWMGIGVFWALRRSRA